MGVVTTPAITLFDVLCGGSIVVAIAAIIAFVYLRKARRAKRARVAWESAARQLGIELKLSTPAFGNPRASFVHRGLLGSLAVFEAYMVLTQIKVALARPAPAQIACYPRSRRFQGKYSYAGYVDPEDPLIERLYEVSVVPPEAAPQILTPELMALIREHQPLLQDTFLAILESGVELRVQGIERDPRVVAALVEIATAVSLLLR